MSNIGLESDLAAAGVSLTKLKTQSSATANTPSATTTVAGTVLQAAAQANSAAAPTQTEFNNLLAKLRTAGILAP